MTLNIGVGHVVKQSGVGTQAITSWPFQGKAQIAIPSFETSFGWLADGNDTGCRVGAGFAVSDTKRGYACMASEDAQAAANLGRGLNTDLLLSVPRISSGANPSYSVDFDSWQANGFVWDWTLQNETGAYLIPYMIFGGDAITSASFDQWQARDTVGDVNVQTVGGMPEIVFHTWNGRPTNSGSGSLGARGAWGFGAFNAAGEQFCIWGYSTENASPTDTHRSLLSDHCFMLDNESSVRVTARFGAMLDDGFRVNFDDPAAPSDLQLCNSLSLVGSLQTRILVVAKDASGTPGATQTVNVGFPIKGVLAASVASTTSGATVDPHHRGAIGFSDLSNHRSKAWTEQDNVTTTSVREYLSNTTLLSLADNDTATVDDACTVAASGNNAILTWGTNSASARRIALVFFGDASTELPVRARPTTVV